MRRVFPMRKARIALLTLIGVAAFELVNRLTHHPGETVVVLMPPVFGAILWWGWPRVRRRSWRGYAVYVVALLAAVGAAQAIVAHVARGRVLVVEVFWTAYFCIAWRLAWAVYARTVGVAGERWRRWGRRTRHLAGGLRAIDDQHRRRRALAVMAISPLRFCAVLFLFAPLVVGSLVHRIKIGNPKDLGYYAQLPIEEVTFETDDGLTLSGWFLPELGSERDGGDLSRRRRQQRQLHRLSERIPRSRLQRAHLRCPGTRATATGTRRPSGCLNRPTSERRWIG